MSNYKPWSCLTLMGGTLQPLGVSRLGLCACYTAVYKQLCEFYKEGINRRSSKNAENEQFFKPVKTGEAYKDLCWTLLKDQNLDTHHSQLLHIVVLTPSNSIHKYK